MGKFSNQGMIAPAPPPTMHKKYSYAKVEALNMTKADVKDPLGEIQRLMDEVLFDPERQKAQKVLAEARAVMESFAKKVSGATKDIRACYRQLQGATGLLPNSEDPGYITTDEAAESSIIIRSKRGLILFLGPAGPYLVNEEWGNDAEPVVKAE